MLKFLVVVLFVSFVNARPDVSSLGYNYAENNGAEATNDRAFAASESEGSFDSFGSSSLSSGSLGGGSLGGGSLGGGSLGGGSLGGGSLGLGSFGSGSFGSSGGFNAAPALIKKQFFLHSAPEDRESGGPKHIVLGKPQKNYRVVFVKAPAAKPTRLSVEYAPKEEKTVIYVLSQKEQGLSESDIVTPAPTQPSKPEVFFVKYKTPQEAEYAQRQIQAQYDALGGSSQFSDEGIAPLRSFIGSAGSGSFGSSSNVNGAYLPPRRH